MALVLMLGTHRLILRKTRRIFSVEYDGKTQVYASKNLRVQHYPTTAAAIQRHQPGLPLRLNGSESLVILLITQGPKIRLGCTIPIELWESVRERLLELFGKVELLTKWQLAQFPALNY